MVEGASDGVCGKIELLAARRGGTFGPGGKSSSAWAATSHGRKVERPILPSISPSVPVSVLLVSKNSHFTGIAPGGPLFRGIRTGSAPVVRDLGERVYAGRTPSPSRMRTSQAVLMVDTLPVILWAFAPQAWMTRRQTSMVSSTDFIR